MKTMEVLYKAITKNHFDLLGCMECLQQMPMFQPMGKRQSKSRQCTNYSPAPHFRKTHRAQSFHADDESEHVPQPPNNDLNADFDDGSDAGNFDQNHHQNQHQR
jgi:hypothetical protein